MTQFGFLIDNRKCIGCHACSTACKSENEVPLGVNRTWVKYVEKGVFPDARRFFQVTRCNHCEKPPCVPICPTTAMYRRADGIVEFDSDRCIGCKACMQACPYDAIHIDPETHTAAKCHFCAHRVEVGLEPACVVVCPEHAIVAGDLDDPGSEIARLVATQSVRVRKPEQGTRPKLYYVDAEESAIVPGAAAQDQGMLWARWPGGGPFAGSASASNGAGAQRASTARGGAVPRAAARSDWRGPLMTSGSGLSVASAMMRDPGAPRETYNAPHRIPWHWQVPAYLVTKAIGAGAFLVAGASVGLGLAPATGLFGAIAAIVALVFTAITTALLVGDLDRPERFWTILIRPQWRSWLTRGSFVLIGYTGLMLAWLAASLGWFGGASAALLDALVWPGVALAALSAVYTAFLFAQAEGRDLWQGPLLAWHLLAQAALAGSGSLLLLAPITGNGDAAAGLAWTFGASLLANLALALAEASAKHESPVAAAAATMIKRGKYRRHWLFSLWGGLAAPLALAAAALAGGAAAGPAGAVALDLAVLLALAGQFAWEWAFVMAPQEIPNS